MKLVIQTQNQENYGAHDWDGTGTCPQYWKFKGGSEFMIEGVPTGVDLDQVIDLVRGEIVEDGEYYRVDIVGYGLEADDYLSWFEKSQLDFDGEIAHPEPRFQYSDLKAVYDREYSEWAADADAQSYGEMV